MNSRLSGLIAAPFTAMQADGSLNLSLIERQAKSLAENHVNGAFICGTTGEGMSLTTDERLQVETASGIVLDPNEFKVR
jgi:N-acetylneuraminate lyase